MKKLVFTTCAMFVMIILQTGCASKMAPVVAKNVDVNENFKNIKTYSWTSDIDNIPSDQLFIASNGVYIFNNESGRKLIKDAIQYELDSRGYKRMEGNSADMLVSFAVLERGGRLRTTNGYVTLMSGEKVRTPEDVSYTDVKPGTLIVNFMDAKNNKQVWQGFASGILQPGQMQDRSKIREAVSKIFSEYKYNNNM